MSKDRVERVIVVKAGDRVVSGYDMGIEATDGGLVVQVVEYKGITRRVPVDVVESIVEVPAGAVFRK